MVYILEAHAEDTWPMKVQGERPRPTSLQQRISYAEEFAAELALGPGVDVYVDSMDDSFNAAFAAWPTCYYVVGADRRLQYVGECPAESDQVSYNIAELFKFLRST